MRILTRVRQHVNKIFKEREVKKMIRVTDVVKMNNMNHSITSMVFVG